MMRYKPFSWRIQKQATCKRVISIIIPALSEGAHLAETLERVQSNSISHETIVVDGGSDDETVAIASIAGARIITAPAPSRSLQMNLGAAGATGDVLLFLHADSHIQKGSLAQIENALADKRVVGGGFARRFDSDSSFLRLTCAVATWRCSLFWVVSRRSGDLCAPGHLRPAARL